MHIEISILLTIIGGTFSIFAYLSNILAKGVSSLTSMKKDIEQIKGKQEEIIEDMIRLEYKLLPKIN